MSEKTFLWRFLAALVVPFLLLVARYRVRGVENIPRTGACIVVANHYSNFDPLTTGYFLWKIGRVPRFLAKASLFRVPVLGTILRSTGQIPVERTGATRGSQPLSAASRLVNSGNLVVICPEGTLTRDPNLWPMRGKSGAVRMALENGVPIVPLAHWGVQNILPRYAKRLRIFPRKTVTAAIGESVDLSALADAPLDRVTLNAGTEMVMAAITALLEDLRGEQAPPERHDPSRHGQSETGRF